MYILYKEKEDDFMTLKTYSNSDTTQISVHFNAKEFRCKCGRNHSYQITAELVNKLEQILQYIASIDKKLK